MLLREEVRGVDEAVLRGAEMMIEEVVEEVGLRVAGEAEGTLTIVGEVEGVGEGMEICEVVDPIEDGVARGMDRRTGRLDATNHLDKSHRFLNATLAHLDRDSMVRHRFLLRDTARLDPVRTLLISTRILRNHLDRCNILTTRNNSSRNTLPINRIRQLSIRRRHRMVSRRHSLSIRWQRWEDSIRILNNDNRSTKISLAHSTAQEHPFPPFLPLSNLLPHRNILRRINLASHRISTCPSRRR